MKRIESKQIISNPFFKNKNIYKIYRGIELIWEYSAKSSKGFLKYNYLNIYNSFVDLHAADTIVSGTAVFDKYAYPKIKIDSEYISPYKYYFRYDNNNIEESFIPITGIQEKDYSPIMEPEIISEDTKVSGTAVMDKYAYPEFKIDYKYISPYKYYFRYDLTNIKESFIPITGIQEKDYSPIMEPEIIFEDTVVSETAVFDKYIYPEIKIDYKYISPYKYYFRYDDTNIKESFLPITGIQEKDYSPIMEPEIISVDTNVSETAIFDKYIYPEIKIDYKYISPYKYLFKYDNTNIKESFVNKFGYALLDTTQDFNKSNFKTIF